MESVTSLIQQKQQEVQHFASLRVSTLEASTAEKEKALTWERAKYLKLKEDFQYNLALLEDRDRELAQFEAKLQEVTAALEAKTRETTGLQAELQRAKDDVKHALDSKAKEIEDVRSQQAEQVKLACFTLQSQADALSAENEKLKVELNERNAQVRGLQTARDEYELQLNTVQRELDALEKLKHVWLSQHESQTSQTLSELKFAQNACEQLQREFDARLSEVVGNKEREARVVITTMQSQLAELDERFKASQSALEDLRKVLHKSQREAASQSHAAQQQAASDASKIRELRQQLSQKDADVKALIAQIDVMRAELDVALSQTEALRSERDTVLQKHSSVLSQTAEQEASLTNKSSALATALSSAQSEIAALKAQNTSLADHIALSSKSNEADRVRLEQLLQRSRDADAMASELSALKQELSVTSAMLRDARTELRVATVRVDPVHAEAPGDSRSGALFGMRDSAAQRNTAAYYDDVLRSTSSLATGNIGSAFNRGFEDLEQLQYRLESSSERLKKVSDSQQQFADTLSYNIPSTVPPPLIPPRYTSTTTTTSSNPFTTGISVDNSYGVRSVSPPRSESFVSRVLRERDPQSYQPLHSTIQRTSLRERLSSYGVF